MKRLLLILAALSMALTLHAQRTDFCTLTASSNLCNTMNVKLEISSGSGAPSSNCVAGLQGYLDTAAHQPYFCKQTNTWVTLMTANTAVSVSQLPNVNVLISTSGPVTDPGNSADYQFNNASGTLTFNVPAGVAGLQRCYRNATGKSGAITLQMATSNHVDVLGADGSSAGTLVSGGALGDSICLTSDATNHWYAWGAIGTWTNN